MEGHGSFLRTRYMFIRQLPKQTQPPMWCTLTKCIHCRCLSGWLMYKRLALPNTQKQVGKCTTEEDVRSTHPCSCQVFPSTNDLLVGLHLAGRLPSCLQAGANRKWIEIVTESTRLTIDVYIYPCLPLWRTWFIKPDELSESVRI